MTKKQLLLSGALTLTAAMAITATAVISAPQFAAVQTADDGDIEYATFKASYPAASAEIPVTQPVKTIWFEYKVDKLYGIKIDRTSTESIVVYKDGVEFERVSVADTNAVWQNGDTPEKIFITLPTELTEVGTYTVDMPSFFQVSQEGSTEKYLPNSPEKLIFDITLNGAYVASPAPGDVLAGGLDVITLTYPDVFNITVGSPSVTLQFTNSGKVSEVCTYSVKANGNVVTLTADDPAAITVFQKNASNPDAIRYDLNINAGAWMVNGTAVPAFTVGHYWVQAFEASSIKMTPAPGGTMNVDGDLDITLTFPEPVTLVSTSKLYFSQIKAYPGGNRNLSAQAVYYDLKEQSADKKTLVLTPNTGATNLGKMKTWINSTIDFILTQGKVQNAAGQKNSQITFPAFNFIGVNRVELATTAPFYPAADFKLTGTDVKYLTVKYLYNIVPSKDESLKATLSRDGEVIKTWTPSQSSPRTEPAAFAAAGTQTAYFNLGTDEYLNSFKPYGIYTLSIPEGFFTAAEDTSVPAAAASWNILNPDPSDIPTPTIAGGPVLYNAECDYPTIKSISEFQIVYPEGCIVSQGSASAQNVLYGTPRTKANKENPASGSSTGAWVTYDKNVATIHFSELWVAVGPLSFYTIKIPASLLNIKYNGVTYQNNQFNVFWMNPEPLTPTIHDVTIDTETSAAIITDIPNPVPTGEITKYLGKPFLLIPESFYDGTGTPYFENAATGEKVNLGKPITHGKEGNATGANSGHLFYMEVDGIGKIPVGSYNLVVPSGCVAYKATNIATPDNTALGFANPEWKFPFTIEWSEMPALSAPVVTYSNSKVTCTTSTDLSRKVRKVRITAENTEAGNAVTSVAFSYTIPEEYGTIYTKEVAASAAAQTDLTDAPKYVRRAAGEAPEGWLAESAVLADGYKATTSVSIPRDSKTHAYSVMTGAHEYVNNDTWTLEFTFEGTTGVDSLMADEAEAEYYTLQGVRVLNPGTGIYIRIADGKATKVIRK